MRKLNIVSHYQPSPMVRLELEYLTERAAIWRIPIDEEKSLLHRIRSGDATAIYPLVSSQELWILKIAKQYLHTKAPVAEMVNAARIALTSLLRNELNNTGPEHYERFCSWTIRQAILQVVYNPQPYQQAITAHDEQQNLVLHKMLEQHLPFLNRLNRELKKVEAQIVQQAMALLVASRADATDEQPATNNEVVEATVSYYYGEDETLLHTFRTTFTYADTVQQKHYGPLHEPVNQTDWYRESYMPPLEEPYCYLLHDLIDHYRGEKPLHIQQISRIDVSIAYREWWSYDLGNGKGE